MNTPFPTAHPSPRFLPLPLYHLEFGGRVVDLSLASRPISFFLCLVCFGFLVFFALEVTGLCLTLTRQSHLLLCFGFFPGFFLLFSCLSRLRAVTHFLLLQFFEWRYPLSRSSFILFLGRFYTPAAFPSGIDAFRCLPARPRERPVALFLSRLDLTFLPCVSSQLVLRKSPM